MVRDDARAIYKSIRTEVPPGLGEIESAVVKAKGGPWAGLFRK